MRLGIVHTSEDDAGGKPLDLTAAIAEFYAEFPERRVDTFILDHTAHKKGRAAVDAYADDAAALQEKFPKAKVKRAVNMAAGFFEGCLPVSVSITESLFNNRPDIEIFGRFVCPAGEEFSARLLKSIFIAGDAFDNNLFPVMEDRFNNTEMWQRYVLDHELGHAITVDSIERSEAKTVSIANRRECEADAYAMIRHFQRYGSDSGFPAYIRDVRNMNVVHKGDVTHWTPRAIDRVIALNESGALHNLSPQQSRDLAVKIAAEVALSDDAEHNMKETFKATALIARTLGLADAIDSLYMEVAKTGSNTKSPAVQEACRLYVLTQPRYVSSDYMPGNVLTERAESVQAMIDQMRKTELREEPQISATRRAFRDAIIDAQSGKKNPGNDNKQTPPRKFGSKPE